MRILNGTLKGRNFYIPEGIRPTQNIVRKAIFDILGHDLSDLDFLELYAGSGSVGLEAISLGARKVVFVEKDFHNAKVIEGNLEVLKLSGAELDCPHQVVAADSFVVIKEFFRQGKKFHMVYFDPPYGVGLAKKTLKTIEGYDILHPKSFIIIEYDKSENFPQQEGRFQLIRNKRYGNTFLAIYEGQ